MAKRVKQERRSTTHYAQDGHTKTNTSRLTQMDRLITSFQGGILPEQANPDMLKHVLDIGCGSGNWLINAALQHPTMSLVGIDIDPYIVKYVGEQAEAAQVSERVEVRCMDALKRLEFPDASFDLVNLRFAAGFLRTWDWPKLLKEIVRVTQPQGIIRVVELETINQSSSAAMVQLGMQLARAFYFAGHFFTPEATGITAHLEGLLRVQGYQQIQMQKVTSATQAETEAGQKMHEVSMRHFMKLRPFIQKWSGAEDYDSFYQQALTDAQQDKDFFMQLDFLIVWGVKGEPVAETQAF